MSGGEARYVIDRPEKHGIAQLLSDMTSVAKNRRDAMKALLRQAAPAKKVRRSLTENVEKLVDERGKGGAGG